MTALTIAAWVVGVGIFMIGLSLFLMWVYIKKPTSNKTDSASTANYEKHSSWSDLITRVKDIISAGALHENQVNEVLMLPWRFYAQEDICYESIDLIKILDSLNKTHAGLLLAKKEIIRYLVSLKYSQRRLPPLLLNGPAGTGKTSLALSIANALGKKSCVISLNGMVSGFEIVGSHPDWQGATAGIITKATIETNSFSPVIILDEVDKCAIDERHGKIWDSLLRVLDRNFTDFRDNFLGISYDISKVTFILTSNSTNGIPIPLLNRLRVVNIAGYTEPEKKAILKNHIIPRLYDNCKADLSKVQFSDMDIERILNSNSYDQGVRGIENMAETIFTDKLLALDGIDRCFLDEMSTKVII